MLRRICHRVIEKCCPSLGERIIPGFGVENAQDSISEVDRLAEYLLKNYCGEIGRGNPVEGESAVDVAIRLLSMLKEAHDMTKMPQY